jgi:uncharacterized cofD-like protein
VKRIWLEPDVSLHPVVAQAIRGFEALIIGPGSFYTSLMPIFLVGGMAEAIGSLKGPVILIANLLTEGQGMKGFTAAEAVRRTEEAIRRPIDVMILNTAPPSTEAIARYAAEHKEPLELGDLPPRIEVIRGQFWCKEIARHDRRRLSYAIWSVLSQRLLM